MFKYKYSREIVGGLYDINNVNHKDGTSESVPLCKEIKTEVTLPDKFKCICDGTDCIVLFYSALNSTQENTLSALVTNQKKDN